MIDPSGISPATFLGRLLRAPLRMLPKGARVRILQGPLRGHRWIVGSASHGCWLGTYEKQKQQLFPSLARPGDVVFDVGANVGFYSLLAATCVGPDGRVFAFEPLPANLVYLRQHLALNEVHNVEVVPAAVGRVSGRASFSVASSRSMGSLDGAGPLEVDVVGLDDLAQSGALPAPKLIKMDIEGGEVDALAGAEQALRRHRPVILLATHGWAKHQECCQFLRGLGYSIEALAGGDPDATDEVIARPRAGS
jgi:FkbM family methyltransferase